MGLRFRKSINIGGARVNISKSGIGASVGGKGFRYTKKAGGGTRTTTSIAGTGISYTKDSSKAKAKTSSNNNAAAVTPNYKVFAVFFKICAVLLILLGALIALVETGIGLIAIGGGILFWIIGGSYKKKAKAAAAEGANNVF